MYLEYCSDAGSARVSEIQSFWDATGENTERKYEQGIQLRMCEELNHLMKRICIKLRRK